jgi:hypothetical protein
VSLTDRPQQVNLQDVYPAGTPFKIIQAWIEGVVPTEYGDRLMGKIVAEPLDGGDPHEFAVWGSLAQQVQQLEDGELPMVVNVVKDGRRWLFQQPKGGAVAQAPLGDQPPPADAHHDPAPHVDPAAAADPPNPAPPANPPQGQVSEAAAADPPNPVPPGGGQPQVSGEDVPF